MIVDKDLLMSGDLDGNVRIWDTRQDCESKNSKPIFTFQMLTNYERFKAPSNKYNLRVKWIFKKMPVECIFKWGNDLPIIITTSKCHSRICVWDMRLINAHEKSYLACSRPMTYATYEGKISGSKTDIVRDDNSIFVSCGDGRIYRYEINSLYRGLYANKVGKDRPEVIELPKELVSDNHSYSNIDISPDGKYLITSNPRAVTAVLSLGHRPKLCASLIPNHTSPVLFNYFSPQDFKVQF
ncbi:hypothetical protein RF11_15719 [Thelohanellus kitauei]|uniref:Uncharacterized protein n=1 Tax=Thelohanellus kitauei TaxID=669202 RepID=A0A0C2MRS1_THEKT|nr:hypothetical protein RF11_15719 [Thelohanellus kitauei]